MTELRTNDTRTCDVPRNDLRLAHDYDAASIDDAAGYPRVRLAIPIEPAPFLVDNIALIMGKPRDADQARIWLISTSTIGAWRREARVPLRYCYHFLKLIDYQNLAFQSLADTIHAQRGFTKDPLKGCSDATQPGPVYIGGRVDFLEIIDRMKILTATTTTAELAEELNESVPSVMQWIKRHKIPDTACHGFCARYHVSIEWLMTGRQPHRNGLYYG